LQLLEILTLVQAVTFQSYLQHQQCSRSGKYKKTIRSLGYSCIAAAIFTVHVDKKATRSAGTAMGTLSAGLTLKVSSTHSHFEVI
jgi:hypothetical protein